MKFNEWEKQEKDDKGYKYDYVCVGLDREGEISESLFVDVINVLFAIYETEDTSVFDISAIVGGDKAKHFFAFNNKWAEGKALEYLGTHSVEKVIITTEVSVSAESLPVTYSIIIHADGNIHMEYMIYTFIDNPEKPEIHSYMKNLLEKAFTIERKSIRVNGDDERERYEASGYRTYEFPVLGCDINLALFIAALLATDPPCLQTALLTFREPKGTYSDSRTYETGDIYKLLRDIVNNGFARLVVNFDSPHLDKRKVVFSVTPATKALVFIPKEGVERAYLEDLMTNIDYALRESQWR